MLLIPVLSVLVSLALLILRSLPSLLSFPSKSILVKTAPKSSLKGRKSMNFSQIKFYYRLPQYQNSKSEVSVTVEVPS